MKSSFWELFVKFWYGGILVFSIIFIDQVVKLFVTIWNVESSTNYGISFGMFDTKNWVGFALSIVGILVLLFIIFRTFTAKSNMLNNFQKTLLLVCLGASLSNFIDRIFRGGVVDYINFFHFTTFNLADMLITSSVIIIILSLFIKENDANNN
jgi:signal peptidase II